MAIGLYTVASIAGTLAVLEAFDRYGVLEAAGVFVVVVLVIRLTLKLVARAYMPDDQT